MTGQNKEKEEPPLLEEPVPIKDILIMTILSLEGKAWSYLGLIAHPETKKQKKDLNEAKLAIDSIESLFKLMEPILTSEERKDIQVRLTNLRLNFVKE
ncbi:MAG: DUF1844 domain-containing protein [candidate division WOR-3 bacterium]